MTISVGDSAPVLEQTISLMHMIAYAGATWDWHRMHYDAAYLETIEVREPVVDGQLFGALLARQVQEWLGPTAVLQRLHFRFKSLVFAGETVRCSATVVTIEHQEGTTHLTLACSVEVVGTDARLAVGPAGADVSVPR